MRGTPKDGGGGVRPAAETAPSIVHPAVVTLEDNVATGGFGSAVAEVLAPHGIPVTVIAVPDTFIEQGGQAELLKQLGLDAAGVAARIRRTLAEPEMMPAPVTQPGS